MTPSVRKSAARYGDLIDRKVLGERIYAAADSGIPDGNPVFLSPAAWEAIKRAQHAPILAAQMLQNLPSATRSC